MAEQLSQEQIIDKLHQDHLQSKAFMSAVTEVVEPIYEEWISQHDWAEIPSGDTLMVPSLWPSITDHSASFDRDGYERRCVTAGLPEKTAEELRRVWLNLPFSAAPHSDLHATAPISNGLEDWPVVQAQQALFSAERHLIVRPGLLHAAKVGETILTSVGEGDTDAYYALHHARYRCAWFIGKILSPYLDKVSADNEVTISKLSRAVQVKDEKNDYQRPHYNPLTHTMLEGMLSVGQSINYLVQGGVRGQASLINDMRSLLANHAPAVMSRAMINGHIGPNQVAGIAVRNAAIRTEHGVVTNPALVAAFRAKRDSERASFQHLSEDDLEWLQDPEVQTVNRFEGCPANRLVRLMDRMLLDALSV